MSPAPQRDHTRITTPEYWEQSWTDAQVPDPIDPSDASSKNDLNRAMHARFVKVLGERDVRGGRLIEIGCGGSRWLPYFHRTFGCDLSGIDYSPTGIRLSERILEKAGVSATLMHGDFFDPPSQFVEQFDVVTSFGLVEHFKPTARAVEACARYLRPGGIMITEVPTMAGIAGLMYRILQPSIYRLHVPQSTKTLAAAHEAAGLRIESSEYLLGLPVVLTPPSLHTNRLRRVGFSLSSAYAWLERSPLALPPNALTSPYALCIATKPSN